MIQPFIDQTTVDQCGQAPAGSAYLCGSIYLGLQFGGWKTLLLCCSAIDHGQRCSEFMADHVEELPLFMSQGSLAFKRCRERDLGRRELRGPLQDAFLQRLLGQRQPFYGLVLGSLGFSIPGHHPHEHRTGQQGGEHDGLKLPDQCRIDVPLNLTRHENGDRHTAHAVQTVCQEQKHMRTEAVSPL